MLQDACEAQPAVEYPVGQRSGPLFVIRGRPGALDRPPLPAGHPVSWGAITDGTVLDQSCYPFPVFL